MEKHKRGFTLVEVSLFLGITALLFLGVTIGVQNSIYQQRYSDAVQSFADYLRNLYASVINVQSNGTGRTGEAIYGKLVTFNESTRAGGGGDDTRGQVIYDYTVIGTAVGAANLKNGGTRELLGLLNANVFRKVKNETTGVETYTAVGIIGEYTPKWGVRVQNTEDYNNFNGTLLIVRDPKSGTVRTYYDTDVIEVNQKLNSGGSDLTRFLVEKLDSFNDVTINFCVNPNGEAPSNRRTNVRILAGANNASGVEIVDLDSSDNDCTKIGY